jgi:hypothetical protein
MAILQAKMSATLCIMSISTVLLCIRTIVSSPAPSSVTQTVSACTATLPAAQFSNLLQQPNIEDHTALYWAARSPFGSYKPHFQIIVCLLLIRSQGTDYYLLLPCSLAVQCADHLTQSLNPAGNTSQCVTSWVTGLWTSKFSSLFFLNSTHIAGWTRTDRVALAMLYM